jgi:hypothetical protein
MDDSTATRLATDACTASVCMSGRAGHTLLAAQRAVAAASPSFWRDGIVVSADDSGVTIALLDGALIRLWNHSIAAQPGSPVAWHPVAETLAADGELHSVRNR